MQVRWSCIPVDATVGLLMAFDTLYWFFLRRQQRVETHTHVTSYRDTPAIIRRWGRSVGSRRRYPAHDVLRWIADRYENFPWLGDRRGGLAHHDAVLRDWHDCRQIGKSQVVVVGLYVLLVMALMITEPRPSVSNLTFDRAPHWIRVTNLVRHRRRCASTL